MKNYLFVDNFNDEIKYGRVENSNLTFYKKLNKNGIQTGNIYRVRVVKKVDALNCFFVEIDRENNGFLDFKDVVGKIKLGDTILVEVYKINLGDKAPNVTMNFSISSDFAVIYFKNSDILLSKKIKDCSINLNKIREIKGNFGIKLRTKITEYEDDFIFEDIKKLYIKMSEIVKSLNGLPTPSLVYRKENQIRDFIFQNGDFNCVLNNRQMYFEFKRDKFLSNNFNFDEEYRAEYDYNIGQYISTFEKREVDFENINIVIEKLEALTVVDVNSKSSMNCDNKNKNSLYVNKIAIREIFRQISFRDISGIILIDLINMNKNDRIYFEKYIDEIKIEDEKIWSFYGFTKTGLYEITRQRGNNGNNR